MTPRQRRLIRESATNIRQMAGPLSLLFYGRLFEMDPGARSMFHGDIARQGLKLMDMLFAVVDNLDNLDALTPTLHAMGQRHTAYGVLPRHYDMVQKALLWALGQALGPDLDEDVRAAWQAALVKVSTVMKEGAAMLPE